LSHNGDAARLPAFLRDGARQLPARRDPPWL